MKGEFKAVCGAYRDAEVARSVEDIDNIKRLDADAKDHFRVATSHKELYKGMNQQLGGRPGDICHYPDVQFPSS